MDQINLLLQGLGILPNSRGFYFIKYAIIYALEDMEFLTAITKLLYPKIAKKFQTSREAVERNTRTALSQAWKHNSENVINLSRGAITQRPTPSQFISILVLYVKTQEL